LVTAVQKVMNKQKATRATDRENIWSQACNTRRVTNKVNMLAAIMHEVKQTKAVPILYLSMTRKILCKHLPMV